MSESEYTDATSTYEDPDSDYSTYEDAYSESHSESEDILTETCDSILVIPFIKRGSQVYFITVLDSRNKEWTFISGTVEKNESCNEAVMRELKEETKNCIDISLTNWNHKTFKTTYIIKNKERNYKVYIIDITNSKLSMLIEYRKKIGNCFKTSPLRDTKFNENTEIDIDTLETFNRKRKWDFMNKILKHPDFIYYMNDIKR